MPKLKKKSYFVRKLNGKVRKILARKSTGSHSPRPTSPSISNEQQIRYPTKIYIQRQRNKASQAKRLASPSMMHIHRQRNKTSQAKRLASPSMMHIHRQRNKTSQAKRLASPSMIHIHRQRNKASQKKRLASPRKYNLHKLDNRECQKRRLLSPRARKIQRKRVTVCQKKRLLSPSKHAQHLWREIVCQKKRLLSPSKHAQHLLREIACQKKRFLSPSKRAQHLLKLRENQRKRLSDAAQRKLHCIRVRKAQKDRLKDPAARVIHIARVISSRVTREDKKALRHRRNLYKKFIKEKKEGPIYSCSSCHRLWFKSSVKYSNITSLDGPTLNAACGQVDGDFVRLCASCYNSIRNKKMPTYSLGNKALIFPVIPEEIKVLSELEERFICPRIPFLTIRAALSDQQYLVKGRAVNVPIEVPSAVSILPRVNSETKVVPICFKRRKSYKTNVAFENVRPHVIEKAVMFLQNSPLYRHFNITVDLQRLDDATFMSGTVTNNKDTNNDHQSDNQEEEDDDEPIIIEDDQTMLLSDAILFAPGEGRKPEPLFGEYVEAQSFIKVYGGELIQQPKGISYQNWIKSEIMRDDRRCAYVTKLFFSALKLRLQKISSSISFCLRKTKSKKKTCTARHILDENTIRELEVHDSGFRVFAPDRGAPAYWELKKKELFAMMRQLGPPTIFLTLSPAETRWPELMVVLKTAVDSEIISEDMASMLSYDDKVSLVKTDPVTVARYFEFRMRRLFHLLKQENSVFREHRIVDYYIRTEFQQRGSPHLHCLLWLRDAPVYHEGTDNGDVCEFIDKFISCSSLMPSDSLELQTHKHTFTCRKGLKNNNTKCRFDIPFFPVARTVILSPLADQDVDKEDQKKLKKVRREIQEKLFDLHKQQEVKSLEVFLTFFNISYDQYIRVIRSGLKRVTVLLKRAPHECMINFFNSEILLLHGANMDIQFITDMYSCATYILNYLNKSNSGMSKLLREAATEIRQGNYTMKEQFRMLANSFLNASEFSAQEAVYYIMAMPLSSCSRQCQFVNTNPPEKRVAVVKRKNELEQLPPDSTDIFTKDVLDHYSQRPSSMETTFLADFVAWYNFSKQARKGGVHNENVELESDDDSSSDCHEQGNFIVLKDLSGYLRRRGKAKIIRFVNYNEHDNEYIRENVMLFWPWRDEAVMTESSAMLYTAHLPQIRKNRAKYVYNEDILNALEDAANRVVELDDPTDTDTKTPQNLRIFEAPDTQLIAAPDTDIDRVAAPDQDTHLGNDIMIPIPKMVNEEEYSDIVSTLNFKQRQLLLHVIHLFKEDRLPFYHCILGGAGVGKSRLINAIDQAVLRWCNREGAQLDTLKVLLCAPTGKAAFGIKGTTLHTAFVLPLNQCAVDLVPLGNATRNTLWSKLRDVKLIIIDEISMVGSRMIQQVDCRLKQIFKSTLPFAGISVIVFGDFNQLAPVGDRYIFESHIASAYGDIIGNPLWDLFTSFTLEEIMRQRDDVEFAQTLNNLAKGALDNVQVHLLKGRIVDPSAIPEDAIRLFRNNAEVNSFNDKIIGLDSKTVTVEAVDKVTGQPNEKIKERLLNAAKSAAAKDSQGLPFYLKLSLNIKYMVTVNVSVEDGLVNGAVGILKQIDMSGSTVTRLWLLFPKDVGNNRRKQVQHDSAPEWTALDRVVKTIKPCKSPHSVVRKQFPLVPAEAITIYKSQGGTYSSVAVHLTRGLRRNEIYVALSRCTKLSGLYLTGKFTAPSAPSEKDKVVAEMQRLTNKPISISCLFPTMFTDKTIMFHNVESLRNNAHWHDFKNFMKLNKPDVFIAAETWTIPSDDLDIDEYSILLRIDCSRQRRPYGLVVYIRKHLPASIIHAYFNDTEGEACCLAAFVCAGVAVCTGYRPPSTPLDNSTKPIRAALEEAIKANCKCVFMGDFNVNLNAEPLPYFYKYLENLGFRNQLGVATSTTNAKTAIDCVFANFEHICGVVETIYSHHKAILSVPDKAPSSELPSLTQISANSKFNLPNSTTVPQDATPIVVTVQPMTLQEAIDEGKDLFYSLASKRRASGNDITKVKRLLTFVRQGVSKAIGKQARNIQLPASIADKFVPLETTGDGNCFYHAISLLLCGREGLALGLRALVAHHMDTNKEFLDNLPFSMGQFKTRLHVLTNHNYAETLEILMMSYILRRPINIYTRSSHGAMRFAPCTSSFELHLLLDFALQHYTALKKIGRLQPLLPDEVQNLPDIRAFNSYS